MAAAEMVDVDVDPLGLPEGVDPHAAPREGRGEEQVQGFGHELAGDEQQPGSARRGTIYDSGHRWVTTN